MKTLLTVSICIPAYNEEKSIVRVLESCSSQIEENFLIEKIVVISDGSSDKTVELAKSVKDPRIEVIEDGLRKGKSDRLNDLNKYVSSDIIVMFDADISVSSNMVVSYLVKPFLQDAEVGLVSGVSKPFPPITFSEKVVNTGIEMWNDVKKTQKNSDLYLSEGQVRAMRKAFYKNVTFPRMSADEAFVFLACMLQNFKFVKAAQAIIYFHLPATFFDYVRQMNRFLKSRTIQEQVYSQEFVSKYFTITVQTKLKVLFAHLFKNPIMVSLYLGYLLFPKAMVLINRKNFEGIWTVISTTKFLPE